MASIADCVERLVVAGQVTRQVADKALGLHKRMSAEFSMEAPPATAEASAALAVAKALREGAAERERYIANKVENYRLGEQRIIEHPYGRSAGLMGILTKDMFRGGKGVRDLPAESPVKQGQNVDYLHQGVRAKLFNMFGAGMEAYKPGFLKSQEIISGVNHMIDELFGVTTGDETAKVAAAGWQKAADYAVTRVQQAGKIFAPLEDWRVPQHWNSERVRQFPEAEYLADYRKELTQNGGGLQLWDKDTNKPATAADTDKVLKRAYSDIISESSANSPFSKEMRTYQFQPGQAGSDSFKRLQAKYGVGDDILGMMTGHLDHMAKSIALQELGVDAGNFAAWMRLVREKPGIPVGPGAERLNPVRLMAPLFQNENMLRATYEVTTGQASAVRSEIFAHVMGGARNLIGASGLRNLPISIIPGDASMTLLAANHMGMDGFKILGEVFDGTTSKEAAQHLQVNSHATSEYMSNSVRKYEDEINYSGVASKVSRGVIKATGADWWTTSGRRAAMTSMMNQIAEMADQPFDKLNPSFRAFLDNYGFDAAQWDKIRSVPTQQIGGAKYYLNPDNIEPKLYERLLNGVQEQSSFMFHQPDARTRAFVTQGTKAGTIPGELMRSVGQFKQFAIERMTTHLMRTLIDGPIENRIGRGLAFTALSMAAGAVSLQAAAVIAGKDPLDMTKPNFWGQAFAKGGAGGIYGDLLASAIRGGKSSGDTLGELAGPLPGLATDITRLATSPIRAQFDESGKPKKETFGAEGVGIGRRFTPNTWYTKLAVDRLFWDKLQTLADPQYRQSFRRAQDRAKQQGSGFWWGAGQPAPERAPDLGTGVGRP